IYEWVQLEKNLSADFRLLFIDGLHLQDFRRTKVRISRHDHQVPSGSQEVRLYNPGGNSRVGQLDRFWSNQDDCLAAVRQLRGCYGSERRGHRAVGDARGELIDIAKKLGGKRALGMLIKRFWGTQLNRSEERRVG